VSIIDLELGPNGTRLRRRVGADLLRRSRRSGVRQFARVGEYARTTRGVFVPGYLETALKTAGVLDFGASNVAHIGDAICVGS